MNRKLLKKVKTIISIKKVMIMKTSWDSVKIFRILKKSRVKTEVVKAVAVLEIINEIHYLEN
jgi:hypothetical protein